MSDVATVERVEPAPQTASLDAWWMLAVLFSLYVFSFIDRQVITMLVPDIKRSLALSDVQMGLVLGPAFAVFYSIFGLPLGWAADRYSRRWVLFIGSTMFGLATASSALANGFVALFLARVFVGVGEASLAPSVYSLLADKFPRRLFTTASAIYNTATKVGMASAYAIGGLAIGLAAGRRFDLAGLGQVEPWRVVLLVTGAPTLLLAVLVFTFREPARRALAGGPGAPAETIVGFLKAERALLIPLLLGFSLMSICNYALAAWTPAYLARRFDWAPAAYGPVLGVVSIVAALTLVFKGGIVDWLYSRGTKDAHVRFYTWLLMGTIPVAAVTFFIPDPVLFMICYGVLQVVALPVMLFMAAAVQMIVPGNLRGQITAVFMFVFSVIGGSAGPVLVAMLTDHLFRDEDMVGVSMAVVICVAMPAALVLLRMALAPLRLAVVSAEARDAGIGRFSTETSDA